jgi:hypothetical protein
MTRGSNTWAGQVRLVSFFVEKKASLFMLFLSALLVAKTSIVASRSRTAGSAPLLVTNGVGKTVFRSQLPLLVDLYWLSALNHLGEVDSAQSNADLYTYGRNLAELDPRFYQMYYFLGVSIPFKSERGYVNGDLGSNLLALGIRQFPEDLRLNLLSGFMLFAFEHKYAEAASVYRKISTFRDAPPYAAPFATRLLAQSGNTNLALELAQQLADSATDDTTKKEYEKRVAEIKVEAQLQTIDKAITTFKTREGRPPIDLSELVSKGDYFGTLTDAQGGTISIGKDGRAATSAAPRRLEIYERDE